MDSNAKGAAALITAILGLLIIIPIFLLGLCGALIGLATGSMKANVESTPTKWSMKLVRAPRPRLL